MSTIVTRAGKSSPLTHVEVDANFTNLTPVSTVPAGFSGLIQQTGNNYLGNGDVGRFAQGFITNSSMNSAVRATQILSLTS